MRRILVVCALSVVASRGKAQDGPTAKAGDPSLESLVRVSGLIGQPVSSLQRIWPFPVDRTASEVMLRLTGAHRLHVQLSDRLTSRDTAHRVTAVSWEERIADSASLRRRVTEVMRDISALAGPPSTCTSPLGPPAYLFAPQQVVRFWESGLSQQRTRLLWDVYPNGGYGLSIDVGFVGPVKDAMPCNARMP